MPLSEYERRVLTDLEDDFRRKARRRWRPVVLLLGSLSVFVGEIRADGTGVGFALTGFLMVCAVTAAYVRERARAAGTPRRHRLVRLLTRPRRWP
jgi:hypothetical protein